MQLKNIKVVSPGDPVPINTLNSQNQLSLLYGDLIQINNHHFVCSKSKRYFPQKDDIVIGKIVHKNADFYRIDLGCGITGFLPGLSFYLATKRNKPDLKIGEYVMARVVRIKDVPLLECKNGMGKVDGYVFDIGGYNVKKMMCENLVDKIGEKFNFKMGMGVNGIVWIYHDDMLVVRDIMDELKNILGISHNIIIQTNKF